MHLLQSVRADKSAMGTINRPLRLTQLSPQLSHKAKHALNPAHSGFSLRQLLLLAQGFALLLLQETLPIIGSAFRGVPKDVICFVETLDMRIEGLLVKVGVIFTGKAAI